MRRDMSNVVTERPRWGHAAKSKKTSLKLKPSEFEKDDVGSTRAPVARRRQYGWEAKTFSDLSWKAPKRFKRAFIEKPLDLIQIDKDNALSRVDGIW